MNQIILNLIWHYWIILMYRAARSTSCTAEWLFEAPPLQAFPQQLASERHRPHKYRGTSHKDGTHLHALRHQWQGEAGVRRTASDFQDPGKCEVSEQRRQHPPPTHGSIRSIEGRGPESFTGLAAWLWGVAAPVALQAEQGRRNTRWHSGAELGS